MMPSSPLYCDACGAANQTQATLCWACGQLLAASTEERQDTSATSTVPAHQPAPAALLAGRYRIIRIVGKGGYGAVYQAEDTQRQRALVAIKSINLHGLSSEEVIEATDTFNRETLLLSELQHPNLPRIYDHFTDREHWYLAMDFIAGETLDEYLSKVRRGHLAVETVVDIGIQLCEVLSYLHSQHPPIIFRDVKPANVMRTGTGHVYLIDFGIARRFRPGQKQDTTVLGSPGYAPPEQYGRAQTTVQSDIYSLGATLYFLLTGKEPSEAVFNSALPYVQKGPVALQQLLAQMLELDAGKRPASMEVVKRTLRQIQVEPVQGRSRQPVRSSQQRPAPAGTAGQALQPPATRAARPGISRRRVIVSLAGLALVGGAFVTAYGPRIIQSLEGFPQNPPQSSPSLLYTYRGHSASVNAVAWSPDGKRIASGSDDHTVQVWDATDGGHVFTYRDDSDYVVEGYPNGNIVKSVAWSPDGRRIASGDEGGVVRGWDAADGGNGFLSDGNSDVKSVAWSPDSKLIASVGPDNTMQVWDATDGSTVSTYSGHSDTVNAVAWSPDGRRIASGSGDHTVQVWQAW